ncbi:MAG TPA: ferritin-like domain-containing protein [Polyangiaceae bacterium]|nr:ferritin-like domain-containing protein [Polyangiaceae bacterium]
MALRSSLLPFRAALFASLGLSPAFFACSSNDSSSAGPSAIGGSGGSRADSGTGGASGNGGSASGGAAGKGSGGSGGAATGGQGGAAPDGGSSICKNPTPEVGFDGKPNGFVDCAGGFTHRVEKKTCPSEVPRSTICGDGTPVDDAGIHDGLCAKDADCTASPNGHCEPGALNGCSCVYGCTTDADCGPGEICGCGTPVGTCVAAACTVDSECGDGMLCMSSSNGACGVTFGCQTKSDTCITSDDCHSDAGPLQCAFLTDHHECTFLHPCGTGRPFLVDGEARVATLRVSAAWCSDESPDLAGLSAADREALAGHWTEVALLEHASIAAFARFSLDLLSIGAPPSLVVEAQSAMADETIHARDAFALASAYAGRPVGPGALAVGGSGGTLRDVIRTAIIEGCVGETIAAVEAREALATAEDAAVRRVLARVAEDEARHGELAWRFVQFVLSGEDRALAAETARTLLEVVSSRAPDAPAGRSAPGAGRLAHGLIAAETRAEIRRRVLADIVRPCAIALVSATLGAVDDGVALSA